MAWSWRNIIETDWLRRAGGAASIMAHVALLALIVFGSGVRLFDTAPPPAIDVELVPAKDAPAETPGGLSLPSLETPKGDDSKPDDSKQNDAKADEPKAEQPDIAKPDDQLATPAPATSAPEIAAPAPEPPALPQAVITGAPVVTPDVMSQYGDPFLSGGFTPDKDAADLKADVVAAFRAHLKSCLKLPAGVSPADDARIVLRVSLKRDGRLAATPALMAAKATPTGPLLMKAAIHALEACQPYAMLPAEKYKEWRELDLEFTPAEFQPG
ncbi:Protein TolA OS=Afipia felis OX=1035 GN=NCTC12722_01856 PE=4 SV=1 [Afipia felis]